MILPLIILIITALAINLFFIINPLSMGLSILIIALFIALIFSYSISSWIAFLIFLIYISGILVIFAYFISLTPNLTINLPSLILLVVVTFSFIFRIFYTINISIHLTPSFNLHHNILYLKFNFILLIILALMLLLTIIIVIKLTSYSKGPLRPFK